MGSIHGCRKYYPFSIGGRGTLLLIFARAFDSISGESFNRFNFISTMPQNCSRQKALVKSLSAIDAK
jgi:hypothetical protein